MFGHDFYYNSAIRKYIIMFGNMFNDIDVARFDNNGTLVQQMRVPISYGPKEKFLVRMRSDPSLDKEVAIQLPRLSFEVTNFSYDPNRTLNKFKKNVNVGFTDDGVRTQFVPVPYNIDISLYGMFEYNEDAMQVVEQILPFFRPEFTQSVKLVPSMGDYYDIPTVLNGMTIEDTYEADFETRRAIIYTFNFVVKGYIFGPVSNVGYIKRTKLNFYANTAITTPVSERITLTPGLLANGSPTTNASASIPISQISSNSNYGFAFEQENFFKG